MTYPANRKRTRFGLRHLLIVIGLIAALMTIVTRKTYVQTEVQIYNNLVALNSNGEWEGKLVWCLNEASDQEGIPWLGVCEFKNVQPVGPLDVTELHHGETVLVRSVAKQLFFAEESPHEVFLIKHLNIDPAKIETRRGKDALQIIVRG